jgi:hypothetical protein
MTQLERFILGEVQIGPHPDVPNKNRLLKLENKMIWDPFGKTIALNFIVYYLDEQDNLLNKESLGFYRRSLIADGVTKMDTTTLEVIPHPGIRPQPQYVTENNQQVVFNQAAIDTYDAALVVWNAAITEYDYFVNLLNTEKNVFQAMLDIILFRASVQGGAKFDK